MLRVPSRIPPLRLVAVALALVAVIDLVSGLGLLPRHDAPSSHAGAPRPARRTGTPPPGTRGVRVVAPGARVRAGDRVDLLVTLDTTEHPSDEPTREVGTGLTVLMVDRDAADPEARGVTLAVPRALVARVAFAATAGALTLATVPDPGSR